GDAVWRLPWRDPSCGLPESGARTERLAAPARSASPRSSDGAQCPTARSLATLRRSPSKRNDRVRPATECAHGAAVPDGDLEEFRQERLGTEPAVALASDEARS